MTQNQIQEQKQGQAIGEIVLAGSVQNADFETVINAFNISSDIVPFIMLESQPRHVITPGERQGLLHFARFGSCLDVTPYTSGRVFHAFGELRWERRHLYVLFVYTGKKEYKPELEQPDEKVLDGAIGHEKSYFLFGKRLDDKERGRIGPAAKPGDFAEVRIPRLLRYPTTERQPDAERVQLVVYEYVNPDTGANIAYRFKGLEPYIEKQERA